MDRILGTVTIGQSPRVDLIPELEDVLGRSLGDRFHVRIIEAGALDGLSLEEVRSLEPGPGDIVLVTRMADGTAVRVAKRHLIPLIQRAIDGLIARGAQAVALVCTGEFPPFSCSKLLIEPSHVLFNVAKAVASGLKLGVMMPDKDQLPWGEERWSRVSEDLCIEAASPYGDYAAIHAAAERLKAWGAEAVVLDCIGYTAGMKKAVREITGAPVILARSILARVLAEVLE